LFTNIKYYWATSVFLNLDILIVTSSLIIIDSRTARKGSFKSH